MWAEGLLTRSVPVDDTVEGVGVPVKGVRNHQEGVLAQREKLPVHRTVEGERDRERETEREREQLKQDEWNEYMETME